MSGVNYEEQGMSDPFVPREDSKVESNEGAKSTKEEISQRKIRKIRETPSGKKDTTKLESQKKAELSQDSAKGSKEPINIFANLQPRKNSSTNIFANNDKGSVNLFQSKSKPKAPAFDAPMSNMSSPRSRIKYSKSKSPRAGNQLTIFKQMFSAPVQQCNLIACGSTKPEIPSMKHSLLSLRCPVEINSVPHWKIVVQSPQDESVLYQAPLMRVAATLTDFGSQLKTISINVGAPGSTVFNRQSLHVEFASEDTYCQFKLALNQYFGVLEQTQEGEHKLVHQQIEQPVESQESHISGKKSPHKRDLEEIHPVSSQKKPMSVQLQKSPNPQKEQPSQAIDLLTQTLGDNPSQDPEGEKGQEVPSQVPQHNTGNQDQVDSVNVTDPLFNQIVSVPPPVSQVLTNQSQAETSASPNASQSVQQQPNQVVDGGQSTPE